MPKEEKKEVIRKDKSENKKIPKDISQKILKDILKNLAIAILIMVYFLVLNILHVKLQDNNILQNIIQICSSILLILGITLLEVAYKKDSGKLAITAIEVLVISLHSLFINHVTKVLKYDFRLYLLTSSYVFAIYYVMKAIIIYTKSKRDYLLSFSDVSEIVKRDEPTVKEAKKRRIEENDTEKELEDIKNIKEIKRKTNEKDRQKENSKTNTKAITKEKKPTATRKKVSEKSRNKKDIKVDEEARSQTKTKNIRKTKKKEEKIEDYMQTKTDKKTTVKKVSTAKKMEKKDKNNELDTEPEEKKVQKPKSKRGRKPKNEVIEND